MASSLLMSRSAALRFLALSSCLGLVPASYADELPPQEAPAFTGVYHAVTRGRDNQGEDWKYLTDDTVTIAVLTKQSRWDHKSDGTTRITDSASRYTTVFGGKTPPNTAYRTRAPFVPLGWEFGYATVAKSTGKAPEVLGTDTVAGLPCTRLRYISAQYGEPEYCVAKSGIVLRFANKSADAEATYEATSITEKAPDANLFTTPPGLTVEERGQARRNVKIP